MPTTLTTDGFAARGEAFYHEHLQAHLEPAHTGKFVVIDIHTGKHTLGPDYLPLTDVMMEANPSAVLCILKIGYSAAVRLGGQLRPRTA